MTSFGPIWALGDPPFWGESIQGHELKKLDDGLYLFIFSYCCVRYLYIFIYIYIYLFIYVLYIHIYIYIFVYLYIIFGKLKHSKTLGDFIGTWTCGVWPRWCL